jgi:hypothetical protein
MKQISGVEEKPFTSSLNICSKEEGGEGRHPILNFPADPWIFPLKTT